MKFKYIATPPGTYAFLHVEDGVTPRTCMMSDLSYERTTCLDIVERAHGNVLIAGLGLGMILHPILENADVRDVTVVEKYRDVIDLISPTLPKVIGFPSSWLISSNGCPHATQATM